MEKWVAEISATHKPVQKNKEVKNIKARKCALYNHYGTLEV